MALSAHKDLEFQEPKFSVHLFIQQEFYFTSYESFFLKNKKPRLYFYLVFLS